MMNLCNRCMYCVKIDPDATVVITEYSRDEYHCFRYPPKFAQERPRIEDPSKEFCGEFKKAVGVANTVKHNIVYFKHQDNYYSIKSNLWVILCRESYRISSYTSVPLKRKPKSHIIYDITNWTVEDFEAAYETCTSVE